MELGLNNSQKDAVLSTRGPVVILAGAGSGKTRVITHRIAHLIKEGICKPQEILAVTFTNKAAKEMKERVYHLLNGESLNGLWIGTFHSNFARLLRLHANILGYSSNYTIYDKEDAERMIARILKDLGVSLSKVPSSDSPQSIQHKISMAKNNFILPAEFSQKVTSPTEELVAQVYIRYQEKLMQVNAMDFDDLLIKPILLFRSYPDILSQYQTRFQQLLVDEFQDTNRVQYLMMKLLGEVHQNICVVGDDAQSIYSWRGADVSNILGFEQDYPEAKVIKLNQNYRCTKKILKAANSVIKENQSQIQKSLTTDNKSGDDIVLAVCRDESREAYKVATIVNDLTTRGGYKNSDIAIFYRVNHQSRALEDGLRQNGIRYKVFGGLSFYRRKEIKNVVAYLRVVINPFDDTSLLRIINFPTRGIGLRSVSRFLEIAKEDNTSVFDVMSKISSYRFPEKLGTSVYSFIDLIKKLKEEAERGTAADVLELLYQEINILEILRQENTKEAIDRHDNLLEFLSFTRNYVQRQEGRLTLDDFMQEISLATGLEEESNSEEGVSLMTIHTAKGLEFPVVCIVGLEERLFPISVDTQSELEEERRLFYVAITRAKEKLFLLYAKNRYRFGRSQRVKKSRFIDEIDGDIVKLEDGRLLRDVRIEENDTHRVFRNEYADEVSFDSRPVGRFRTKLASPHKATAESNEARSKYVVGMNVSHQIFGYGKIVSLDGEGESRKARVMFKRSGEKLLMLKYAKLEVKI